jgi:predicted HTH domain antitoxin
MTRVNLDLPEEVFSARRLPPDDFVRDMRLVAAIYWYQKGEVSQEKAAQIAGLSPRKDLRDGEPLDASKFNELHEN